MAEWKRGDQLGPYRLETDFRIDGGGGAWAVGSQAKKRFHLKLPDEPKGPGLKNSLPDVVKANNKSKLKKYVDQWRRKIDILSAVAKEDKEPGLIPPVEIHEIETPNRLAIRPVIASEFVESVNIDVPKISGRDAKLQYLASAADQLARIHAHKLVHSDVKPSNLPWFRQDGAIYARLLDFDGSYFLDDIPEPERYVFDQVYVAPEVSSYINGKITPKALSPRVDVFSLGVLALRLFGFDWGKARYPCEQVISAPALVDKAQAQLEKQKFSPEQARVMASSVSSDPGSRPGANELASLFKHVYLGVSPGVATPKSRPASEPVAPTSTTTGGAVGKPPASPPEFPGMKGLKKPEDSARPKLPPSAFVMSGLTSMTTDPTADEPSKTPTCKKTGEDHAFPHMKGLREDTKRSTADDKPGGGKPESESDSGTEE